MDFNSVMNFFRNKFHTDYRGLLSKYRTYKETRSLSGHLYEVMDEKRLFELLEILEHGQFHNPLLFSIFEQLIYLNEYMPYRKYQLKMEEYLEDSKLDTQSIIARVQEISEIIQNLEFLESHTKTNLFEIGADKIVTDKQEKIEDHLKDSDILEELIKALQTGKNKILSLSGDNEFLVSKIPLHGNGLVITPDMKIDNRVFYTDTPEHIIEMAMIANPGVYIIASIPYGDLYRSGFYILLVTKGDAYLIDNNEHTCRNFVTRNPNRHLYQRAEGTYLPWSVIDNFLEHRNESTEVIAADSKFSFKSIGMLTNSPAWEILWIHAFIDTCIITIKNDLETKISVALTPDMVNTVQIESKALIPYTNNLPSITDQDLEWDPKIINNHKSYNSTLEPLLPEVKIPLIKSKMVLPREELRRQMMYAKRKEQAEKLSDNLQESYVNRHEKALEQVKKFILQRFQNRDYWLTKSFEDRNYPVRLYYRFGIELKHEMDENGSWIENVPVFTDHVNKLLLADIVLKNPDKCASCEKNTHRSVSLVFKSADQFATFFEIDESEHKMLPDEFWMYFHQEQTRYYGNSILNDIDPLLMIHNPWWRKGYQRESPPMITLRIPLCGRCRRKYYRKVGRTCPKMS